MSFRQRHNSKMPAYKHRKLAMRSVCNVGFGGNRISGHPDNHSPHCCRVPAAAQQPIPACRPSCTQTPRNPARQAPYVIPVAGTPFGPIETGVGLEPSGRYYQPAALRWILGLEKATAGTSDCCMCRYISGSS